MKISKIFGLAGATLLLIALVFCLKTVSAEATEVANARKALSGLVITNLDKPVAGVPFDSAARVETAEGVTWEIPVLWIDEFGNMVKVPEKGKTYYPVFLFYVPEGYTVRQRADGTIPVTMPDFLGAMFGAGNVVFAADTSNGVTYIIFSQVSAVLNISSQGSGSQGTAVDIGRNNEATAEVAPAPVAEPAVAPAYNPEPIAPAPAPAPTVSAIVERYCSEGAIAFCGNDFLESTIDLIKNRLQPQATNLLMEKIAEAEEDEEFPLDSSSAQIDLYIYFAQNDYSGTDYDKVLAIDLAGIAIKDENDNPCIPDANKAELDGMIVEGMTDIIKGDYDECENWDDSVLATDADDLPLDWTEDAEADVYVIAD